VAATLTTLLSSPSQIAYLVLVSALNNRGGELLPPPPEAFGL
jgi:hypothetical protein